MPRTKSLPSRVVRLAHQRPDLRPHLLPLLRTADWRDHVWESLPDDVWSYFIKGVPGTILVPLRKLTPTRAREKGIANANKYMMMAYRGEGGKRKPLDLKDNGNGTFTVLDGNSTFANAKMSGWKALPGIVVETA